MLSLRLVSIWIIPFCGNETTVSYEDGEEGPDTKGNSRVQGERIGVGKRERYKCEGLRSSEQDRSE